MDSARPAQRKAVPVGIPVGGTRLAADASSTRPMDAARATSAGARMGTRDAPDWGAQAACLTTAFAATDVSRGERLSDLPRSPPPRWRAPAGCIRATSRNGLADVAPPGARARRCGPKPARRRERALRSETSARLPHRHFSSRLPHVCSARPLLARWAREPC
jgi:hypothetical protein